MSEKEKVSVIIPTYNNAEFLPDAIGSVISQTYRNIELIVVNDGSTDNTDEVVHSYLDKIIYIKQQNAGPASARNKGIQNARGEYIAFLDADDVWVPNKIEEQMRILMSNPQAAFVYAQMINFDHFTGKEWPPFPRNTYSGKIFDKILTENFIPLDTVLIKRFNLEKVGGFDETLLTSEDINLYLKVAKDNEIIGINMALLRRRKHNHNLSDKVNIRIGTLENLDKIVELFPETSPKNYPAMKRAYINRGKKLMEHYWFRAEYSKCRHICYRLKSVTLTEPAFYFIWFMTLLPSSMLNFLRTINKQLKKLDAK